MTYIYIYKHFCTIIPISITFIMQMSHCRNDTRRQMKKHTWVQPYMALLITMYDVEIQHYDKRDAKEDACFSFKQTSSLTPI